MAKTFYTTNSRFNSFILIYEVEPKIGKTGLKYKQWICLCDCGVKFKTTTKQISKGRKSCGCLSISNRFKNISDEDFFKTVKLNHYKTSAKRRNIDFNLNSDLFFKLITSDCIYCGSKPLLKNKNKNHTILLNGIDRVDNNIGYIEGNVVSCCYICNKAKGILSLIEFKDWINRLINFNTKNENKIN